MRSGAGNARAAGTEIPVRERERKEGVCVCVCKREKCWGVFDFWKKKMIMMMCVERN